MRTLSKICELIHRLFSPHRPPRLPLRHAHRVEHLEQRTLLSGDGNALFVWRAPARDGTPIDPTAAADLARLARSEGIRTILYDAFGDASCGTPSGIQFDSATSPACTGTGDHLIRAIIDLLHENCLRVEALYTDSSRISDVLAYNRRVPREHQFDGIRLNFEGPWPGGEFEPTTAADIQIYLDAVAAASEIPVYASISHHWDNPILFAGVTKPAYEHIIDITAGVDVQTAWEQSAEIVHRSEDEVRYGSARQKAVLVTIETYDVVTRLPGSGFTERNTFFEEGVEEMKRELDRVVYPGANQPHFAIHFYQQSLGSATFPGWIPHVPAVAEIPHYELTQLPVGGADNTTGIAILGATYGTTDAFEEVFEIRQLAAPHNVVAHIRLADLQAELGVPIGSTSGGPDGMTSVTAHDGFWYVLAAAPVSSPDAIFRISADGVNRAVFAPIEIHNRGDLPFNRSEIEFLDGARSFLARTEGLIELDAAGQIVRSLASDNFDGVAVVGNALFAITREGRLFADWNLMDADFTMSVVADLDGTVADLTFGSFGTIGAALFVATETGNIGFWPAEALVAPGPLGQPEWLFNIPGLLGKIAFSGGDLYASLGEEALRVREVVDFQFEVTEREVVVTEGRGPIPAIRLHLTAPPNRPITATISRVSGDADITVVTQRPTPFDTRNWRADAYDTLRFDCGCFPLESRGYVLVEAAPDPDASDGSAIMRISAPGMDSIDVTVREQDKDGPLGIELRQTQITVREGRSAIFQARLTADPLDPVLVRTQRFSGDADLRVESHDVLTFDSSNWDRWQWISIAAEADSDHTNGMAIFAVATPGLPAQFLTASEVDSGPAGTSTSYDVLVDDYTLLPVQGETQPFAFYNRLQGDRGKVDPSGAVEFKRGLVEARTTQPNGFAGVFHSLNHTFAERLPLNFQRILPGEIQEQFQYRVTAIFAEIEDGVGTFKLELKDRHDQSAFEHLETLTGGRRSLRVPLPSLAQHVQMLTWLIIGDGDNADAGEFVHVKRVGLEVEGPRIDYLEAFLWPYAALLANFDAQSGLTRDRASFPAGDFDGVNTSGVQAAAAAVAAHLGIISHDHASEIVSRTAAALLDLQQSAAFQGVLPHFVRRNFVVDNEASPFDPYSSFRVLNGTWTKASHITGFYGTDYLLSDSAGGSVEWNTRIVRPGDYEVFARWVDAPTHARNAPYTIAHANGLTTVRVDQTVQGDEWVSLGRYALAGTLLNPGQLTVRLDGGADGTVIADAIRVVGPPHVVPNTEFSTIDSVIGLLGTLLAAQALDLPTDELEQAIRNINWQAATLASPPRLEGVISHGYTDSGILLQSGWDTFGGESLMVALAHAAATGTLPRIPDSNPSPLRTFNGSGFIDEILWILVEPIARDAYGADWDAYRPQAAARQVAHYATASTPLFGASAVEPPIPSQFPVCPHRQFAIPYRAYGIGGIQPNDDGTDMFAAPVAAPHYAGMVWSLRPDDAERFWDEMQNQGMLSPLNMIESVVVQQWGRNLETHAHSFKGSLNLGLWSLGTARHLIRGAHPLFAASRANEFLNHAMEQLGAPPLGTADLTLVATVSPDPVIAGNPLTYELTVHNNGSSDASGVSLADSLPPELTGAVFCIGAGCEPNLGTPWTGSTSLGVVPSGSTRVVRIRATVGSATPNGMLANLASVTALTTDSNPSNNSAEADSSVVTRADLAVSTTDSPDPIKRKGRLSYTITTQNAGPSDATHVIVQDTLPAGTKFQRSQSSLACRLQGTRSVVCSVDRLPAGSSSVFTITVTAPSRNGTITNTVTVAADQVDPDPSNNDDAEQTRVGRDPRSRRTPKTPRRGAFR